MDIKLSRAAPLANALLLIGFLLPAGQAAAAEYWLCAKAGTVDMPGSPGVPIWGYVLDDNANLADGCPAATAATLPSPPLTVPAGDTTLTVHLRNELTLEPTSIVIPGQGMPVAVAGQEPVWTDGATGARTAPGQRVRSFTHEAAPNGGTADYTWNNVRPGSYLYHSGTHPQVQVQMGLYGALTKNAVDAAPGVAPQAYAGVPYDAAVTLLFSEIDPAQHAAINAGTFGTASAPATPCVDTNGTLPMTSALCYKPKYFLINGKPYQVGDPPLANLAQGQATLLRLLNAGNRAYVPLLQGTHMTMIAEDGNRYQYRDAAGVHPRDQYQYSTWLAALKTTDTIVAPTTLGRYPFYDRRLNTVNAGNQDGGIFGAVQVAVATQADLAITKARSPIDVYAGAPVQYTITVSNTGPGGVTGATLADAMPTELTGVTWTCTATPGSTCPVSGTGNIASAPLNLATYGTATFVVSALVNAAAVPGTALTNTATTAVPATMTDPNSANNSATDSTTILAAQANLGISITDGVTSVVAGSPVSYTIVANNAGPAAVTGATVVDTLPAALTNASWTCTASAGSACAVPSGTGSIGTTVNLASGGSVTFVVNATVNAAATGTLANTATVAVPAGVTDPVPANDSATDTDTISPPVTVVAYFSTTGNTAVPGVAAPYDDADIYARMSDNSYRRVFSATAAGLPAGANVDAFIYNAANDIYLSFGNPGGVTVPGIVGTVQDEDIVHWNGTAWSMYFNGGDVGLADGGDAEDVDAFALLSDGSLLVSITGNNNGAVPGITGAVTSRDLIRCVGTFGPTTTCTWTMYFQGADVGLTTNNENVRYAKVMPNGDIRLRTTGAFTTYNPPGAPTALTGTAANVFSCNAPTTGTNTACTSFSNVLTLPTLPTGSMDSIHLP